MFVRSVATAVAILLTSVGVASAQSPTRIQQFNAWGAYSYKSGNSTVCYVLSIPTSKEPASVDHGDIFFIVSQRPGQNISYEPQAMVGYPLKQGSKVNVTIDNKNFVMFTKDKAARVENAAEEPARGRDEGRQVDDGEGGLRPRHRDFLFLFAFGHFGCF